MPSDPSSSRRRRNSSSCLMWGEIWKRQRVKILIKSLAYINAKTVIPKTINPKQTGFIQRGNHFIIWDICSINFTQISQHSKQRLCFPLIQTKLLCRLNGITYLDFLLLLFNGLGYYTIHQQLQYALTP